MINRVLIRLKIVQIIYAYYQNGGKNLDTAEKELFFSLSKAYDLYNYLLLLMVEVTRYAHKRLDAGKHKLVPTKEDLSPNTKFVDNRFIAQLEVNKQLNDFSNSQKKTWENEGDFIKNLCEQIMQSDIYKEYMASETSSYEEDREVWRKIYKKIIFNNPVAGGIANALDRCAAYQKEKGLNLKVEIECRSFDEINQVMAHGGADRIMLDNFSVEDTKKAVELIDHKFETESSGGITYDTLRDYAECGVDFISVGALTHSVKGLDMSFKAC